MTILNYPEKQTGDMPTPLQFARDGYWKPEILLVDENLLCCELVELIQDEVDESDPQESDDFKVIHNIERYPFRFTVDVSFTRVFNPAGSVNPGKSIMINDIGIEASWGRTVVEGVELAKELPVKWNKESLIRSLEIEVKICKY